MKVNPNLAVCLNARKFTAVIAISKCSILMRTLSYVLFLKLYITKTDILTKRFSRIGGIIPDSHV